MLLLGLSKHIRVYLFHPAQAHHVPQDFQYTVQWLPWPLKELHQRFGHK